MAKWMKTVNEVRFDLDKMHRYFIGETGGAWVGFGGDNAVIIQRLDNANARRCCAWIDKQLEKGKGWEGVIDIPDFSKP